MRALSLQPPESVPVLQGDGVTRAPGIHGAGVELAEGEVLGLAGLLGSGRTELARALTGIDRPDAGIITISGQPVDLTSPRKAISLGVVYSSENRRTEGIISELSVQENITLALQAERGILRRMRPQRRRELAMSWIEALDIRPADPDRRAGTLSGLTADAAGVTASFGSGAAPRRSQALPPRPPRVRWPTSRSPPSSTSPARSRN